MQQREHRTDGELPFEPEPDIKQNAQDGDVTTARMPCWVSSPETLGPTTSTERILNTRTKASLELGQTVLLRLLAAFAVARRIRTSHWGAKF